MPNPERLSVWSEQHNDAADSVHAIGQEHEEDVLDRCTKQGQLMLANCQHCGRQWKGIVTWSEISMFFTGDVVQGTRTGANGVTIGCGCGCGKMFPMQLDWDEIRKYVDNGIRIGALRPEIKRVARR